MELKRFKRPFIIAHRGYRAKYPENTLTAFEAALDIGVQMIELDVTLTGDRNVVVIHDNTLDRTTDGKGLVKSITLEGLKQLDAGRWFHPRFAGERIPTLEEVLNQVAGRACLNVEIKRHAYEAHKPSDAVETQVVELFRRNNAIGSVLISSFEPKILENITTIDDAPALALLSKYPGNGNPVDLCTQLKVFSWHPNCRGLEKEHVEMMHKEGIWVFPYNVDSLEEFQQVIRLGVDGVITSDPLQVRNGG